MVICLLTALTAFSQTYSGGNGTDLEPYQIKNLRDLRYLSEHDSDWGKYFIVTADINAKETQTWNEGKGFSPIGLSEENSFHGYFDGDGHEIYNIYINQPEIDNLGFFGFTTDSTTIIKNIGISQCNVTGFHHVGALIGNNENAQVSGCYSSGNVNSGWLVGGLIGNQFGNTITDCYSIADVNAKGQAGGLIGQCSNSNVDKSYFAGTLTAEKNYGGLIGNQSNSTVTNSFWDKEKALTLLSAGGLAKTTEEMKNQETYTEAGWDFEERWQMDSIHKEIITNDYYPYFQSMYDPLDDVILSIPKEKELDVNKSPLFYWLGVDGAVEYHIYVALDEAFENILVDTITDKTIYASHLNGEEKTSYYWKVYANSEMQVGSLSDTWKFTIDVDSLAMPILISPDDLAEDLPLYQEFSWNEVLYADRYEIVLSADQNLDSIIINDTLAETSYKSKAFLFEDSTYYWTVRALYKNKAGNLSLVRSFTTGNFPPELRYPKNLDTNININPYLSWAIVENADRYQIQVARSDYFNPIFINKIQVKGPYTQTTTFEYGKKYYWRVRAKYDEYDRYSKWSEIYSFITEFYVGVQENEDSENYSVMPNPAQNYIRVNANIAGHIQIFDVLGNLLIESDSTIIDVTTLPTGTYYLWIIDDGAIHKNMFIKE